MDNITQGVIGGWIMDKVVGEAPGNVSWWQRNKVFILGGLIANIPDLDIFLGQLISHKDYMSEFLFHRGVSHSVFFNIFVAAIVWWLCSRKDRYGRPRWRWALGSYISILLWHLLIDAMTSYGGRYLLPFSTDTYSLNNIFVIDLFYTIPLIVFWFVYIFLRKKTSRRIFSIVGAIWIVLYPAFTFVAKHITENTFASSLNVQWRSYSRMMSSPEPLQAFLWRGVVQAGQGYYEGYYSLFDKDKNISWHYIPNHTPLRKLVSESSDVKKIEQRANGRTSYSTNERGHIVVHALKMGDALWRQNTWAVYEEWFTVTATGLVIWQTRRGGSIREGFGSIWRGHWKRVRGEK